MRADNEGPRTFAAVDSMGLAAFVRQGAGGTVGVARARYQGPDPPGPCDRAQVPARTTTDITGALLVGFVMLQKPCGVVLLAVPVGRGSYHIDPRHTE